MIPRNPQKDVDDSISRDIKWWKETRQREATEQDEFDFDQDD